MCLLVAGGVVLWVVGALIQLCLPLGDLELGDLELRDLELGDLELGSLLLRVKSRLNLSIAMYRWCQSGAESHRASELPPAPPAFPLLGGLPGRLLGVGWLLGSGPQAMAS